MSPDQISGRKNEFLAPEFWETLSLEVSDHCHTNDCEKCIFDQTFRLQVFVRHWTGQMMKIPWGHQHRPDLLVGVPPTKHCSLGLVRLASPGMVGPHDQHHPREYEALFCRFTEREWTAYTKFCIGLP
jgi:hypothetical protein